MSLKNPFRRQKKEPRFSSNVREFRERAVLSILDVADYCQVSEKTIELIEEAKYEPSVVLAEHLARRLNVNVEALFTANAPVLPSKAGNEERIQWQLRQATYWCFYSMLVVSGLGSAFFISLTGQDTVTYVLVGMLFLFAIVFLILASRIPDYIEYIPVVNRARTPKTQRILLTIVGAVIAATSVFWFQSKDESLASRIIGFFFFALLFGIMTYWMSYRRSGK